MFLSLKLALRYIFSIKRKSFSSYASFLSIVGLSIGVMALVLTSSIIKKYPNTKIKKIPANRADVYQTFGNNKKIVKELKIRKFTKIDQGLKKTINWFKISKVYKLI